MVKLIFISLCILLVGCTSQKVVQPICIYIEPEYETEVVDFGGLADEQCADHLDTIKNKKLIQ